MLRQRKRRRFKPLSARGSGISISWIQSSGYSRTIEKLRGIAALNDPDSLSSEVASRIGGSRQRGKIEIIRYVAERSCTVRLRLEDVATVSYGKFYRPGESDPAWNAIGSLWQSESCRSGSLTIPEPLIRLDESESVWLREVRGVLT
jgi:hypothetical protein